MSDTICGIFDDEDPDREKFRKIYLWLIKLGV